MMLRSLWSISFISWVFPVPTTTEGWLQYHRTLRDVGTLMVVIGVVAEILIDEFWDNMPPPLLRGRRATTLLKTSAARLKRCALIFAGIILVAGGLLLEYWQGNEADDVSDQIRTALQQQVLSVTIRNAALTMMASGRAAQIIPTAELPNLKLFPGMRAEIMNVSPSYSPSLSFQESWDLAAAIVGILKDAGWDVDSCNDNCPSPVIDVMVLTKELPEGLQQRINTGHFPSLTTASPDEKAFLAANALVSYLQSVGIEAIHRTPGFRITNAPMIEGEVLILVGIRQKIIDPGDLNTLEQALVQQPVR
jgi:hypothetical protein